MLSSKSLLFTIFWMVVSSFAVGQNTTKSVDYTQLVNPMVGTDGHGHTFPGATLPHGTIQLSPDTRLSTWDGCSGYHYSDQNILGFSHTHFSGTGVGSGADIMLMPTTGAAKFISGEGKSVGSGYRCSFLHQNETATPGYYSVKLDNGIFAELTCTERVGMHQYTFPPGKAANLLLNLSHGITTTVDSLQLTIVSNTTLTGFRKAHSSLDGNKTIWFVIEFSRPFAASQVALEGQEPSPAKVYGGKELKANFNFRDLADNRLQVRVALSRVDLNGAWNNLKQEVSDWDFERIKREAKAKWQKELSKIEVEGGSLAQRRTFYTALYHCFIHPNIAMDADRRYFGTDHKIRTATDFDYYTTFSLWDTFRALHPLYTIINQQKTNQFIRNFIERYQHFDTMMIMEFGGNEGFGMIGYHALPVIADAWVKGIRDYNAGLVLEGMKHLSNGIRAGKEPYKVMGFVPYNLDDQSVSKTLEYCYDDWSISRVAKDLNQADYIYYCQKGNFYQNLYDPKSGFMRGKSSEYQWQNPFDARSTAHFTEGNAYQFSLFVPQDYQGLFRRMGGDEAVDQWLDKCFTTEMDSAQARTGDMTGNIGQYVHGNEPSHHMAYLYNYIGKPWKSQERIRQILETLYSDKPDGLSGNEDAGQMSAWYVLSAMGIYATTPGMDYYVIGSPLFPKVTIHLENGNHFSIHSPATSSKNRYVRTTRLNGVETTRSYLNHADIMKGGELFFEMQPDADSSWGSSIADRPYSDSYPTPLMVQINKGERYFKDQTEIVLSCEEPGAEIRYTLNGEAPTGKAELYKGPFLLNHSALLKASSFAKGLHTSFPASAKFTKMTLRSAIKKKGLSPGLKAAYFEGYCVKLADMKKYNIIRTEILPQFDIGAIKDDRSFGYYFNGFLNIPETGVYTFYLNSNDGSNLTIDGQLELVNDGFHRAQEVVCKVLLEKGFHSIAVDYFQMGGSKALSMSWSFEGGARQVIPASAIYHESN